MELFRSEEMQLMQVSSALVHAKFECHTASLLNLVQNPDEGFVLITAFACSILPHTCSS